MRKCEECEECVYICEGDFTCMEDEPKIVIIDFKIPTEEYGQCNKKATKETDQSIPK